MINESFITMKTSDLVFTSKSFGLLRSIIIKHLGIKKAKHFLMRFGKELGIEKAKELLALHKDPAILMQEIPKAHIMLGHVSEIHYSGQLTMENNKYIISKSLGYWKDSFEVDIHLEFFGKANECSCYTLSGFASGMMSTICNEEVYVKEITCRAKGDDSCSFQVETKESWIKLGETFDADDVQSLLDELDFTYDKLYEQKMILKKVTEFHSKITENIAQQNDINKLLTVAHSMIDIPIFLTDLDGNMLYSSSNEQLILNKNCINALPYIKQSELLRNIQNTLLVTPIYLEFKPFGYCIFRYNNEEKIDENDYLFLERLATAASLCFLNEKVRFEATERLKITFLDFLIQKQYKNYEELNLHSKYITPKISPPFQTISINIIVKKMKNYIPDLYQISLQIAKLMQMHNIAGLITTKENHLVLFIYNFQKDVFTSIKKVFSIVENRFPQIDLKAGVSKAYKKIEEFHNSLVEAEQAMNSPKPQSIVFYEELGFLGALIENFDATKLIEICKKEFGELLLNDEKNKQLLYTLYIYLKNNQKLEKTMQDLLLSIGGVRYRIEKIEKILNKNLKDASTAAHVLLLIEALLLIDAISFAEING